MIAMAMVVAAGTHQSNSLQSQAASLSSRLPSLATLGSCTSVCKFRAFAGDCFHTKIACSPRRTSKSLSAPVAYPMERTLRNLRFMEHNSLLHKRWDSHKRECCGGLRAAGGDIMEGDVVEYPLPEEVRQGGLYGDRISYGLGAVSQLVSDPFSSSLVCHVEPLVMNEPPQATWVVDERQDKVVVPLTQVRRLEAWLSMRMVDDRISNPHGEHAEHLWLVEEPLSESSGSPMYDEA